MPRNRLSLVKSEPSLARALATVLALLASFGITWAANISDQQQVLIVGVLTILAPIVQGLWTRYAVTANAKVVTRVTTAGAVVAGDAAALPTGTELPYAEMGPESHPTVIGTVPIQRDLVDLSAQGL